MKSLNQTIYVLLTLAAVVAMLGLGILHLAGLPTSYAAETSSQAVEKGRYETFSFFAATTTSGTSTSDGNIGMDIKGAEAVTLYFSRAWDSVGNAGTSSFNIQVSPDEGVTWLDESKLISNTTNTNAQQQTRVSSVQIAAATSTSMVALDLRNDAFSRIRCIVVETTDGAHTCTASAKF